MSDAAVPSFPSYSCSEHFRKHLWKSPYFSNDCLWKRYLSLDFNCQNLTFVITHSVNLLVCRLRILVGKKHPKIKLQRLRKIPIWTFGSVVYQINFLRSSKTGTENKVVTKNKVVTGKTALFVMGPF